MQPITQTGRDQKLKVIRLLQAEQEFFGVIDGFGLITLEPLVQPVCWPANVLIQGSRSAGFLTRSDSCTQSQDVPCSCGDHVCSLESGDCRAGTNAGNEVVASQ